MTDYENLRADPLAVYLNKELDRATSREAQLIATYEARDLNLCQSATLGESVLALHDAESQITQETNE